MTYCPDCKREVEHQAIPEDSSHCPCVVNGGGDAYFGNPRYGRKPCYCACHGEES